MFSRHYGFLPTTEALRLPNMNLNITETELFSSIETTTYFPGAVYMKNILPGASFQAVSTSPSTPPPNDGEPVAFLPFLHFSPQESIVTT